MKVQQHGPGVLLSTPARRQYRNIIEIHDALAVLFPTLRLISPSFAARFTIALMGSKRSRFSP